MNKEIEGDNDLKEYCLDMLLGMCVKAGVDVSRFEPKKGPDGDIVAVTILGIKAMGNLRGIRCAYYHAEGNHYQRSFGVKKRALTCTRRQSPKGKLFYLLYHEENTYEQSK